jgi:transposase
MKASHGGKAKHDPIDAQKIAALRRGGMLPHADVYSADMRATRDLLRRRTPLRRTRAALLAHVQHTHSPYNLPEIGQKLADKANREGVAHRLTDLAGPKNLAVDLALLTDDDALLSDLELYLLTTAKPHDAHTLDRWQTVPGIGKIRSLVRLYEIHDIDRFPRVQDFVSSGRLVKCAQEAAGTRLGPSGKNIGNAHLKGAVSEAAALFRRTNDPGQT